MDFIEKMFALYLLQNGTNDSMVELLERHGNKEMYRNYLENHPSIKNKLTDQDLILIQIDGALESRNKILFTQLTNELKNI